MLLVNDMLSPLILDLILFYVLMLMLLDLILFDVLWREKQLCEKIASE